MSQSHTHNSKIDLPLRCVQLTYDLAAIFGLVPFKRTLSNALTLELKGSKWRKVPVIFYSLTSTVYLINLICRLPVTWAQYSISSHFVLHLCFTLGFTVDSYFTITMFLIGDGLMYIQNQIEKVPQILSSSTHPNSHNQSDQISSWITKPICKVAAAYMFPCLCVCSIAFPCKFLVQPNLPQYPFSWMPEDWQQSKICLLGFFLLEIFLFCNMAILILWYSFSEMEYLFGLIECLRFLCCQCSNPNYDWNIRFRHYRTLLVLHKRYTGLTQYIWPVVEVLVLFLVLVVNWALLRYTHKLPEYLVVVASCMAICIVVFISSLFLIASKILQRASLFQEQSRIAPLGINPGDLRILRRELLSLQSFGLQIGGFFIVKVTAIRYFTETIVNGTLFILTY